MHAVGHYVLQHDQNLKLTYISSERFMNEMINAVRYDRVIDFRERYRSVDLLLQLAHQLQHQQFQRPRPGHHGALQRRAQPVRRLQQGVHPVLQRCLGMEPIEHRE